jgi:protein ImuB
MFAVVYIPGFPMQALLRHEPESRKKPVALVDPALSTPRVCEMTAAARASGVVIGMAPTQAMARCRQVLIRHRSPAQETAATDALLLCAFGFSPNIEATAPGICTLDLRGLAELNQADGHALAAWAERLRAALASFGLRARVGIGPTPNMARQAARWTKTIQVVGDARMFITTLPIAALDPSSDVAPLLAQWGIRTVGELLALGQQALAERIGLEALALFAAASTASSRPLRLVRPVERFEEAFEFSHEIETIEPLLMLLRRFVDQISRRLELAGVVAECLTLRLRLESGELLERRLRLPRPTSQPDVLFRMLHTHLETLRTTSPVVSLALQASPGQPEQKQFGLFEAVLRDPRQFQETLARLTALLGDGRVGTPVPVESHGPDSFELAPPDFENAPIPTGPKWPAVLQPVAMRRCRPPVKAGVETVPGCAAGASHPAPVSLQCSVTAGRLKVTAGPWLTSGHWWEPGACWQREEWDVATRDGWMLRLCRQSDGWAVEGLLD